MTARVFPFAHLTGQVPGIHILQARAMAHVGDAHQLIGAGLAMALVHFVIGMKRGDVPGHQRIDGDQKIRHALKITLAIAEARHDQRDNFHPEAALFELNDRFGHVGQNAAELAIVFVVKCLEIDLVGIDERTDVIQCLRGGVAVADVGASQSGTPRGGPEWRVSIWSSVGIPTQSPR